VGLRDLWWCRWGHGEEGAAHGTPTGQGPRVGRQQPLPRSGEARPLTHKETATLLDDPHIVGSIDSLTEEESTVPNL
jgi:hypothetical protein